ncbi:glycosyltransferase [Halobacteriales archaeon Cl-PHB]
MPTLEMPAGGIENLLWNLLPNLQERGIDSQVISLGGDGELRGVFADMGATVSAVNKSSAIDVMAIKSVVDQIDQSGADIVHLHQRWIPLRLSLYYLVDVPLVVTYHNVYDPDVRAPSHGRWLKMRFENRLNTLYDYSIFVSNAVKETHHPDRVPENSRVIYAGIDFSELATGDDAGNALKQSYDVDSEKQIVGALGRFVPQKGFTDLLRAFSTIASRTNATLVLGGDGPQRDELEALAQDLGIEERVHFVGYVHDQYEFYAMSDVFIVPSRFEGLPVTLIEVCATGTPVIASDIAPLREVLGTTPAPLVEPGNVDGFANAIVDMLHDDSFRTDVGDRVRTTARSMFDIDSMVQQHAAVYESVSQVATME